MPLKTKYLTWYSFSKATYLGNHLFTCKAHGQNLTGEHCRICFQHKLRPETKGMDSRPLCKEKNGIIDGIPYLVYPDKKVVTMTRAEFKALRNKSHKNIATKH